MKSSNHLGQSLSFGLVLALMSAGVMGLMVSFP
jgi:hypothetical protein